MNFTDQDSQQGAFDTRNALTTLGIDYETTIPDNVLTAVVSKGVRFRESSPRGYAHGDIESFIFDSLIPSLEWYADALYKKDISIHRVGEELDRLAVENHHLRAQLENKDLNDAFSVLGDETEAQAEWQALMTENVRLKAENTALKQQVNQVSGYTDDQVSAMLQKMKDDTRAAVLQEAQQQQPSQQGYTQEQVDSMLAQARAEAVAEYQAQQPSQPEPDTNKALQDLLEDKEGMALELTEARREKEQLLKYVSELEEYNKSLGGQIAVEQPEQQTLKLPPINPEDL